MSSIAAAVQALLPPDADAAPYLEYHRRRYQFLLESVDRTLRNQTPREGEPPRVLDVGMAYQTCLVKQLFPDVELATLGFFDYRFPRMEGVQHTQFNLNAAAEESEWPALEPFDLVLLAEVIEHLYVPPTRVLKMLRALLRPGGVVLIQTPNPVNLARRLALLRGRSPFEIIRDDPSNPGHYCEYTVEDLMHIAAMAELEVVDYSVSNYFGTRKALYDFVCALLPGRMAEGITMLLRRPYS
ncbi:MAG: class I SAM-dependent methyltransferase [Acidobacteria bacterium]|nr:class I SAM-dependent methyltransferase [Acidobacteriota bacterium]